MSILIAVATAADPSAATQPSPTLGINELLFWLFLTALAVSLLRFLRVFARQAVVGPIRMPQGTSLASLFMVFGVGSCMWLFAQAAYVGYRQADMARAAGVDIRLIKLEDILTPSTLAILGTVPQLLGFLTLVIGNWLVDRDQLRRLGLGFRGIGRGVLQGILGYLIVVPFVMWTLAISEMIYRKIQYVHPKEHPLLKSLGNAETDSTAILILLGATVMAPFLEELLFRGHFQTLLREFLARYFPRRDPKRVLIVPAIELPADSDAAWVPPPLPAEPLTPFLNYLPVTASAVIPARAPVPAPWHGWVAILITSLIFALVHDAWSRPAIFVLALGLGYIYERTGKLWASITIHVLFNGFNTLQYWLLIHAR
jgi:membrane protease YdiL (CAAX protease family)